MSTKAPDVISTAIDSVLTYSPNYLKMVETLQQVAGTLSQRVGVQVELKRVLNKKVNNALDLFGENSHLYWAIGDQYSLQIVPLADNPVNILHFFVQDSGIVTASRGEGGDGGDEGIMAAGNASDPDSLLKLVSDLLKIDSIKSAIRACHGLRSNPKYDMSPKETKEQTLFKQPSDLKGFQLDRLGRTLPVYDLDDGFSYEIFMGVQGFLCLTDLKKKFGQRKQCERFMFHIKNYKSQFLFNSRTEVKEQAIIKTDELLNAKLLKAVC
jgi:hypothetical protein